MTIQLRGAYLSILITLLVQFMLGMATNLFVQIPTNHPGANPPEYFSGVVQSVTWAILHGPSIWLVAHAVLGLLIVLSALGLLFRTIPTRNRLAITTSVVGALAVLAAGFNGGSYLNYHQDFSSMIMATFFGVAVTAYLVGLFGLPPQQESQTSAAR
ncbi:MAG TPA: hypothetical protein VMP38_06140 [Candidatus Acidoferrum sp.]|nr:hypothetical protein [Candidatus Acidoferrum sp.]